MKFLEKLFGPPVWEMDPNHRVEWKTDYSQDNYARDLEKELSRFGKRVSLFFRAAELSGVSLGHLIRSKFGLKSNTAYLLKLTELLEDEVDCYLLDKEPDSSLREEYSNIKFLGGHYDPDYDHEAYIKKAKENSITG